MEFFSSIHASFMKSGARRWNGLLPHHREHNIHENADHGGKFLESVFFAEQEQAAAAQTHHHRDTRMGEPSDSGRCLSAK